MATFRPMPLLPATAPVPGPRPVPAVVAPQPAVTPATTGDALTLDALMARQKQAAEMQGQAMQQPVSNIPQGLSQMAWTLVNALQERKATNDIAQGQQDVARAMGTMNYDTGELSPEAMQTLWQREPETAADMMKTAMTLRQAKLRQENWVDIPAPPGSQPGQQWQQSTLTGEKRATGGQQMTGESKFDQGIGEEQSKTYSGLYNDAIKASQDAVSIGELEGILNKTGSGMGQGVRLWAKNKLGLTLGDDVSDLQAAQSIIAALVPAQRMPGTGTLSDKDIALLKSSVPDIWNSPGGNARIIARMKGLIQYRKAQGEIAAKVMNHELTRDQGFQELYKIPNPLADLDKDPAIAQQQPAQGGATGAATQPPAADATGGSTAPAAAATADQQVEPYPQKPANYSRFWPTEGSWAKLSPQTRSYYIGQAAGGAK